MPYSKPMKVVSTWMEPHEKARLDEIAAERNLTLAAVMREGLRLYLQDLSDATNSAGAQIDGQLALR